MDLQLVSFLPQLQSLDLGIVDASLEILIVSSQLALDFAVTTRVLDSELECVVVLDQLLDFCGVALLHFLYYLLGLQFLALALALQQLV